MSRTSTSCTNLTIASVSSPSPSLSPPPSPTLSCILSPQTSPSIAPSPTPSPQPPSTPSPIPLPSLSPKPSPRPARLAPRTTPSRMVPGPALSASLAPTPQDDRKALLHRHAAPKDEATATLAEMVKHKNQDIKLLQAALLELNSQNQQLSSLLRSYEAQLAHQNDGVGGGAPIPPFPPSPKSYIGPWECSPTEYPLLLPTEAFFRDGRRQQALNTLVPLLARQDIPRPTLVNARLLSCALIQSTGVRIDVALAYAEDALTLACRYSLHGLRGKAQYWRGLCHLVREEWAEARWCFVFATAAVGHERAVEEGMEVVERELERLPRCRREVKASFRFWGGEGLGEDMAGLGAEEGKAGGKWWHDN